MKVKTFWIGFGAAMGAGMFLALSRGEKLALPWSSWRGVLVERHGAEEGRDLLEQGLRRWRELLAAYPQPLPKPPLRNHLVNNILTGLAMYQVLIAKYGGNRQAALAEIEPLFQAWTKDLYGGLMKTFRRLPFVFWFFRLGIVANMFGFSAETWRTNWIEDNSRRVAFDHFKCPYVDTLGSYGAPELTPYFCRIDEWMSEMLPPTIAFRRTQTLATGGDFCDFCYERVKDPSPRPPSQGKGEN